LELCGISDGSEILKIGEIINNCYGGEERGIWNYDDYLSRAKIKVVLDIPDLSEDEF